MHLSSRLIFLAVGLCLAGGVRARAADAKVPSIVETEELYELRIERLLKAKGTKALVAHLEREVKERPRPYVKAWYANYLLYGVEFGLKDVADPVRGFALAQEAQAEGSLFGLELVARAWGDGRGAPQRDLAKAVSLLGEAAHRRRNSAMSELGKYYFFGLGVPEDRNLAELWVRDAACRGATGGMVQVAEWWENPQYTPKPDPAKALALYFEAAELGDRPARALLRERAKKGEREAQKYVHLGLLTEAVQGGDPLPSKLREAVKWLEANAAADDLPVQLALADVMKERRLVVCDIEAAKKKLARAAAAGSDDARAMQAMLAWLGIGQKADPAGAVAVWSELAKKNNGYALNQLGWAHWWGNAKSEGLEKDAAKAFHYCKRSADLGYWAGQLNLAECYNHGLGTEVNYFFAAKYYGILADRGYRSAREMKERILALVKD